MAAAINFYANIIDNGGNALIDHLAGSGLGFYGTGFGLSVPVGASQTTTFVTDANGIEEGVQLNNTKMNTIGDGSTAGTVSINSSTAINNNNLPNYLCPLNIRFTNDDPVRVQNCKLRIFDRNNIDNPAVGVTTYLYEARHPSNLQTVGNLDLRGRPSNAWVTLADGITQIDGVTTIDMPMTASPGMSGLNTSISDTNIALGYVSQEGAEHTSMRHDWYLAISSEPESIGAKTQYGLYFSLEYLA